ncbi:uncharacterized protein LDX57_006045 [Aspergillus melleus]|uniref:uncharacterized protein n=1 Tax=Aspergillus melleus TaxID=138277 RepID=UPI001E8E1EA2|nr:uncharacterized protein LDX57_006045 [Aspergillus melleus]KAH8428344.1 hypothetical protein LDX57_006045 [Aspergillus melleus]
MTPGHMTAIGPTSSGRGLKSLAAIFLPRTLEANNASTSSSQVISVDTLSIMASLCTLTSPAAG